MTRFSTDTDVFVAVLNIIFSAIFFCEMVIKLIGFGFHGYMVDEFTGKLNGYNIFDAIVVTLSIVDILLSETTDFQVNFPENNPPFDRCTSYGFVV
jgi:hypothetical protein